MRHRHGHRRSRGEGRAEHGRRGRFRGPFPGFPPRGNPPDHPFGPFGSGGPELGRRGGRRANVRAAILALLNERSMHGYEMIQELDQRTGGVWRPSPGSVYPTLQLLEDEGLVASQESGGRKAYSLTEKGREEANQAAEHAPWMEFSEETVSSGHNTREAVAGVLNALRQIRCGRDRTQWSRAVEVLNETRRKLYAILAEM
ncbi:MAG TPA: PadR family transcriptional regulator [Planctomycetaceae bacterium]|nr:PadR family transcriptional regulator [Planctomycetaceae bacterium]